MAEFILGLPSLASKALVDEAKHLQAPVLVSANAFSKYKRDDYGIQVWNGFNTNSLKNAAGMRVCLDSAGFVAMAKYRGFHWTVEDYMKLCAAWEWEWFASMDMCVEPEVARDEGMVLDRISGTIWLNRQCAIGAAEIGKKDRLMPVIQGWRPDHYRRCIDRMGALLDDKPLIGVGSMCRRNVEGNVGIR